MATDREYEEAAKTPPSVRTVQQEALVADAIRSGMVKIKNLDHDARQAEKYNW